MSVVFDEVIASVEPPRDTSPPETAPVAEEGPAITQQEIIDAVETRQRRARRLQAD